MFRVLALALLLAAPAAVPADAAFKGTIRPLSASERSALREHGFWRPGCPVALGRLRLLDVTHRDWRGRDVQGQVVVNARAAYRLRRVFRKLHALHFPIRHMRFGDVYTSRRRQPRDGDLSGSFECRQAVPSPCSGGSGTGTWSNHAYGLALDLNPRENPYVGCGMTYNRTTRRYMDRRIHRKGMITRRVVGAFASIGWEWGGSWSGNTKDWMHFSHNGR